MAHMEKACRDPQQAVLLELKACKENGTCIKNYTYNEKRR